MTPIAGESFRQCSLRVARQVDGLEHAGWVPPSAVLLTTHAIYEIIFSCPFICGGSISRPMKFNCQG
jgi:hypothetical protein